MLKQSYCNQFLARLYHPIEYSPKKNTEMLLPWGSLSRMVFPAAYNESHTKYLAEAEGVWILLAEKKKGPRTNEGTKKNF